MKQNFACKQVEATFEQKAETSLLKLGKMVEVYGGKVCLGGTSGNSQWVKDFCREFVGSDDPLSVATR